MNASPTGSKSRHQTHASSGSEQRSSTHGRSSDHSTHTRFDPNLEAKIDMMLLEGKVLNVLLYGRSHQMPPAYLMRSTDVVRG